MYDYSLSSKIIPLYLLISNMIYFVKSSPIKVNFCVFWVLNLKFVKFFQSILNWQAKSCSNFASFFIFMTYNSHVNIKQIHHLLRIKGPKKVPFFRLSNLLWQRLRKFFISFMKALVCFLLNFELLFSAIKITLLYNFQV